MNLVIVATLRHNSNKLQQVEREKVCRSLTAFRSSTPQTQRTGCPSISSLCHHFHRRLTTSLHTDVYSQAPPPSISSRPRRPCWLLCSPVQVACSCWRAGRVLERRRRRMLSSISHCYIDSPISRMTLIVPSVSRRWIFQTLISSHAFAGIRYSIFSLMYWAEALSQQLDL